MCSQNSEIKQILTTLLARNHVEYDINYKGYLANHVPHALCTLYSLGATKERLSSYYEYYGQRLEPLRPTKFSIHASNWETYIGDKSAYPEFLKYFDDQFDQLGLQKTLDMYFPRLLPGLAGVALHPLIHIAYGVEYDNGKVLAEGLAYACTYYNKGGEIIDHVTEDQGPGKRTMAIFDLITEFKLEIGTEHRPERKMFDMEMSEILIMFQNEIKALLEKWNIDDKSMDELTNVIIRVFFGSYRAKSLDFFLAHGLTGSYAVRTLLPHIPEVQQKRLLKLNLLAIVGLYFREGMPEFDEEVVHKFKASDQDQDISWDEIVRKAINCPDEHVMKVVRSLKVIKESVPSSVISHELLDRCAYMMVHTIEEEDEWIFKGIGYITPEN